MKKFLSVLIISLAVISAGSSLFAENAVVTYVKGKVEVQKGSQWVPLNVGDEVSKTEIISTGFQSEAKVKLLDSVLYLGPVTRIAVEELSASSSTDKVSVYLKTGTVRSQVNHTENKRVNYQVHTAVAVASARGTDYVVCNDETIVIEGVVAVEAYVPPAAANAGGDSSDVEEEAEDASETSEEPAAEESKGVLVKANQSVKVSSDTDSSSVSVEQPVNTVVQSVNSIVSVATTAAAKEAVQSSTVTVTTPTEKPSAEKTNIPTKGSVELSINVVD